MHGIFRNKRHQLHRISALAPLVFAICGIAEALAQTEAEPPAARVLPPLFYVRQFYPDSAPRRGEPDPFGAVLRSFHEVLSRSRRNVKQTEILTLVLEEAEKATPRFERLLNADQREGLGNLRTTDPVRTIFFPTRMRVLRLPAIEKQLRLSAYQRKKIAGLPGEVDTPDVLKQLLGLLSQSQRPRLEQLYRQLQPGMASFYDDDHRRELRLTRPDDLRKLAAFHGACMDVAAEYLIARASAPDKDSEPSLKQYFYVKTSVFRSFYRQLAVNPERREALKSLFGEPWDQNRLLVGVEP